VVAMPSGTVTFLFTDIEGSTRLWERDATAMRSTLNRHDEILRSAIQGHGGVHIQDRGRRLLRGFRIRQQRYGGGA
jgi:class 3 adenylate cyclase